MQGQSGKRRAEVLARGNGVRDGEKSITPVLVVAEKRSKSFHPAGGWKERSEHRRNQGKDRNIAYKVEV